MQLELRGNDVSTVCKQNGGCRFCIQCLGAHGMCGCIEYRDVAGL